MTKAELTQQLIAELKKRQPNPSEIKDLNNQLDSMTAEQESNGAQVSSGALNSSKPMTNAKGITIELKTIALRAITRASIIGDAKTQNEAVIAMDCHLDGTLSDDEYIRWSDITI
jgi:hypothetical protein